MSFLQIGLLSLFILLGFICSYYQLKIVGSLKEGYRSSMWSGRWLFHPEWLDGSGRNDRRKFLVVFVMEFALLIFIYLTIIY